MPLHWTPSKRVWMSLSEEKQSSSAISAASWQNGDQRNKRRWLDWYLRDVLAQSFLHSTGP